MKELKSQKNNKKYGESLYINLDENEKKIFSELMIKENRNKSNLASYIIKEYLKEYQAKQAEDIKKGTVNWFFGRMWAFVPAEKIFSQSFFES